jgi:cysteine synthase A
MQLREGFVGAIGNTPLIRLGRLSEQTGCEILGKAEFLNPGGSIKDRTAWFLVEDFEKRGLLEPGGVIVEGTAGNTGIGLSLVAAARGYRAVIVMPETQSEEKKSTLKLFGADLRLVKAVPYKDPNNYVHVSERLAAEMAKTEPHGAVWAQQFDNTANREGHYRETGREIWEQTGGRIDGFVSAIGTGGTLSGVGACLKEKKPEVKIALADPMGAAMYAYFTRGVLESSGSSITEGIGQGRVTKNVDGAPVDVAFQIPDDEMLETVFSLLRDEGLCVGGSTGINVAGAVRLAKEMGPGHTIVTILCDGGQRYQSKMFNAEFLRAKGLPVPNWLRLLPEGT